MECGKPLFGSQGKDIKIIKNNKLKKESEQVYYLQRYENIKTKLDEKWQDFRIFVCNNKIIASMIRKNKKKNNQHKSRWKTHKIYTWKRIKKNIITSKSISKS